MTGTLLSLGHGYVSTALAQALAAAGGWRVIGTTRSPERAAAQAPGGVQMCHWPGEGGQAGPLGPALEAATHLLVSLPPGPEGDPALQALGPALRAARHLRWVGYLSTTGVYGDTGGAWVNEDTPAAPSSARGQARLAAEAGWLDTGLAVHVFRLSGIYGPGRAPFAGLRAGTARAILKPGHVFNRIHVSDIVQVLAASIARPAPGRLYNLADDLPAPPQDVLAHAAALIGLPPPPEVPYEQADLSPMARSFYAECKRVENARICDELGVRLACPTYREGLAATLAAEDRAPS